MTELLRSSLDGLPTEARLVRRGNVSTLEKPGVGTITTIYSHHSQGKHFPNNPAQFPPGINGIVLERTKTNYLTFPFPDGRRPSNTPQYSLIFQSIEAGTYPLPVFMTDSFINDGEAIFRQESQIEQIESMIGLGFLLFPPLIPAISRRRFLQAVTGLAGLWLTMPSVSTTLADQAIIRGIGEAQTAELKKLTNILHPEDFLRTVILRDVIAAEKQEWLMRGLGGNTHMVNVWGAQHPHFEIPMASSSAARLDYLNRAKMLGLLEPFEPETIYKGQRYDFAGGRWQVTDIFEVPPLKEIAS